MIDSVRQTVLSILNKNNYGYISPSDFNLYAKQAQLEIFDTYMELLNAVINAENGRVSGTEYADMNKGVREVLDTFSVTSNLTQEVVGTNRYYTPSQATVNDDYYLINVITVNGAEAEYVTHGKINMLNASFLTAPTLQYPAYTIDGDVVSMYPNTITGPLDVVCQFIRYPRDPQWTYSQLLGGEPVFNQTLPTYQDFELPIEEEPNLVYRILQMAGVSIREADIYQYADAEQKEQ